MSIDHKNTKSLIVSKQGFALDIDETLSWTLGTWVGEMQKEIGNPENLTVKEIIKKYRYTFNVPYWQTEKAKIFIDKLRNSNELQTKLELMPNALEGANELNKLVPVVAYITTRPEAVREGTLKWLKMYKFPQAELIMRPKEVLVTEANTWKAKILEDLYPSVLGIVDDNPDVVEKISSSYKGVVFMFENSTSSRNDIEVYPCEDWDEVISKAKEWKTN